jgi:twinkle protein
MESFSDYGIDVGPHRGEEVKTTCPQCSPTRKKKNYPCLNVNTIKGCWHCWHCGWSGFIKGGERTQPTFTRSEMYNKPEQEQQLPLSSKAIEFFEQRGISVETLEAEGVCMENVWMPQVERHVTAIAFPYYKHGELVNFKYRDNAKNFRQVSGCEKVFYRYDHISVRETIIVEGEMDALTVAQCGMDNVVSVPDGAPAPTAKTFDHKFEFLNDENLDQVERFIIAVDSDEPGRKLEEELSRRLGKERCSRVMWPDGCKDANETLLKHGADAVRQAILDAQPYPIEGVLTVDDFSQEMESIYSEGMPEGADTGWRGLNDFYRPLPGQLCVITGIPGSGKSEWLDALTVNLTLHQGWTIGIFSPENQPSSFHAAKLMEKCIGKPLREMTREEFEDAKHWLKTCYRFLMPEQRTIADLLSRAKVLVRRFGMKGLILDPYNELTHTHRKEGVSETEYISDFLAKIKSFAQANGVHVWLVAHPAKLRREMDGSYPVPTVYDIAGSANFANKADVIITVHRDKTNLEAPTEIHVQKMRSRWAGKLGQANLFWEGRSGRYRDGSAPPVF